MKKLITLATIFSLGLISATAQAQAPQAGALQARQNLSDLSNMGTAQTNLFSQGNAGKLWGTQITSPIDLWGFGDSLTLAVTGTTSTAKGYFFRMATEAGSVMHNLGNSGDMACDNEKGTSRIFGVTPFTAASSVISTTMFGVNEANSRGTTYEPNFRACNQAIISWAAIPFENKIYAQNAAVTLTGTWTSDTLPQTGIGKSTIVNASTMAIPITTYGGPIYIWYVASDTNTSSFTYQLDSGSTPSQNTQQAVAIATLNGSTSGMMLLRITNVAAGAHTVNIVATASAGNAVDIWSIGTPQNPAQPTQQLSVYVGGVIRQQSGLLDATTLLYDTDSANDVILLAGDGLPVRRVDTRSYVSQVNMTTALHPNDAGQEQIKNAFEGQMQLTKTGLITNYLGVNSAWVKYIVNGTTSGSFSNSALSGGFLVSNNGGALAGIDFGYDVNFSYGTRLFTISGAPRSILFGQMANNATAMSSFTTWGGFYNAKFGVGTAAPLTALSVVGGLSFGRTVVADVAYTVLSTDYLVAYTTLTAARAVTLTCTNGSAAAPQHWIIKDEAGTALTNNITFAGNTIDGAAGTPIIANYGTKRIYANGTACFSE